MFKRYHLRTAAFSAAVCVLIAAAGCSGKESPPTDAVSSSEKNSSAAETTASTNSSADAIEEKPAEDLPDEPKADEDTAVSPISSDNRTAVMLCTEDISEKYAEALEMFSELGGELKLRLCAETEKYDRLAADALAKTAADIMPFDNAMAYPFGCVNGLFSPADTVVELSSPLWQDTQDIADMFSLNGYRYVAPISCSPAYALFYDKDTAASYGSGDPYELYLNGEWDHSAFDSMIRSYRAASGHYGISGEFEKPLIMSTGKTLINFERESESFYPNLFDSDIAATAEMIYALKLDDICDLNIYGSAGEALGTGALFFAADKRQAADTEAYAYVPFPTYAEDGSRSYQAEVEGFMFIKGGKSTDTARCFAECAKLCSGDIYGAFSPDGSPVYDYGMGISRLLSDSSARLNEDYGKAVIPFIYSAPYDQGAWDSINAYYAYDIFHDLSDINNTIRTNIYGKDK